MKKILLLLAFALATSALTQAQTAGLNRFIDDHRNDAGFTFAFLSKELFEVVSQSDIEDKDWKKLHQVVRNIGSLRILAGDSLSNARALYKEAASLVPTDEFDELLAVRAEHDNVRIWSKDDGSMMTDLVLLVGTPDDFVLICFAGELELSSVMQLARLFHAAEATELAAASRSVAIDFQVSPNPTAGLLQLSYGDPTDPPAVLTVTDQNGRLVKTVRLEAVPTQEVNLRDLATGVYWLQVKTTNGKVGVKQVVIARA